MGLFDKLFGKTPESSAAPTVSTGLVEASAIAFTGSKYYIFSDEQSGAYTCNDLKQVNSSVKVSWFSSSASDFEGAGVDFTGNMWVTTSHSVNKNNVDSADRKQIIRVRNPESVGRKIEVYTHLRESIVGATNCPQMLKNSVGKNSDLGGLNIEGMTFIPTFINDGKDCMILGFRGPLTSTTTGEALICRMQFYNKMIGSAGVLGASDLGMSFRSINLGGLGIRDMYWDGHVSRLFIIGGNVADGGDSKLFTVNAETWQIKNTKLLPNKVGSSSFNPECVIKSGDGVCLLGDSKTGFPSLFYKYSELGI